MSFDRDKTTFALSMNIPRWGSKYYLITSHTQLWIAHFERTVPAGADALFHKIVLNSYTYFGFCVFYKYLSSCFAFYRVYFSPLVVVTFMLTRIIHPFCNHGWSTTHNRSRRNEWRCAEFSFHSLSHKLLYYSNVLSFRTNCSANTHICLKIFNSVLHWIIIVELLILWQQWNVFDCRITMLYTLNLLWNNLKHMIYYENIDYVCQKFVYHVFKFLAVPFRVNYFTSLYCNLDRLKFVANTHTKCSRELKHICWNIVSCVTYAIFSRQWWLFLIVFCWFNLGRFYAIHYRQGYRTQYRNTTLLNTR